jgi:hypothetical protein
MFRGILSLTSVVLTLKCVFIFVNWTREVWIRHVEYDFDTHKCNFDKFHVNLTLKSDILRSTIVVPSLVLTLKLTKII